MGDDEFERLANSRAHQFGSTTGEAASMVLPLPGPGKLLAAAKVSSAFARIGSLTGKRMIEVRRILQQNGFKFAGRTEGGYIKFYGPGTKRTRAEIQIRPNGQVVRSSRGGVRYDSGGNIVTSHTGGEFIGGNFIGP